MLLVTELGDGASTAELRTDLSRVFLGRTMNEIAELAQIFCLLVERRSVPELQRLAQDPPQPASTSRPKPTMDLRRAVAFDAFLEPVDQAAEAFRLQGETIVGRSKVCDLAIASPKISRQHTKLSPTPEGFAIEDLGSANKTWLNGTPVEKRTKLSDGDLVAFGEVAYVYRVRGPASRGGSGGTSSAAPKS